MFETIRTGVCKRAVHSQPTQTRQMMRDAPSISGAPALLPNPSHGAWIGRRRAAC